MDLQNVNLPENIKDQLEAFTEKLKDSFNEDLVSVVLFGSGAEGKLRATSDVNILVVLKKFDIPKADKIRESLRLGQSAIKLSAMFLLEIEIPLAAEAFAVKFSDIIQRNRILFGRNPFDKLQVSREASIYRLNQVLFNLMLRLRERYTSLSLREEQLVPVIADFTGPLRASAASILSLKGIVSNSPKDALEQLCKSIQFPNYEELLKTFSQARESRELPPGTAGKTTAQMLELLTAIHQYATSLK